LTFGIKSLATSDLWFTFQALIPTNLCSNQLNDVYTYRCMANMTATTQKMKNYEGISLYVLM